jgi:hypothetical protein
MGTGEKILTSRGLHSNGCSTEKIVCACVHTDICS